MSVYLLIYCLIITKLWIIPCEAKFPQGHGEVLGKHRPSDGHVKILHEIPSPQKFWEEHAHYRTPVVFKGAAKSFPAFNLWTDEYLVQKYGDLEVKLEAKKEKDEVPVGIQGLGRDTIKSYLSSYKNKDSYIVSQLPDPMATEINVLPCLSCGTFVNRLMEANLWLSSGGTSSMLHRDADNAINCLLNGTKDWILIDPKHEDKIPIAKGDSGYGGFAVLDVNKVNLLKYSKFQNVPWHYANLTAGDCLYLPYGYWHQVRSFGNKNMAVSVLFSRLKHFEPNGCDKEEYKSYPLADANMIWTYPGHGPQTLGNGDPFEFRDSIMKMISKQKIKNEKFDNFESFSRYLVKIGMIDEDERERKLPKQLYNLFKNFTNDNITSETFASLSIEQVKSWIKLSDLDPANTEEYEYYTFSQSDISEMVDTLMESEETFGKEAFKNAYKNLGGSEKIALELFSLLDSNNDEYVTEDELSQNGQNVLDLFENESESDPSGYYYSKELQKDKEMMQKDKETMGNVKQEKDEL
ncbi:uncharacterized protein LOC124443722 [Xenia sp. Carnegie-2017]|uniref:uncharacterized protein LOC124443722 n=1 Tax=Xenia sp. Carnegie-2017 TaxID=2897299 RepID=UPI001F041BEF|nr:uncharacterized protein LOC124443722 [Xenia sp. Carnegie-2017]